MQLGAGEDAEAVGELETVQRPPHSGGVRQRPLMPRSASCEPRHKCTLLGWAWAPLEAAGHC